MQKHIRSPITHHPREIVNLFTENEDLNIDTHFPLDGDKCAPSVGIGETGFPALTRLAPSSGLCVARES